MSIFEKIPILNRLSKPEEVNPYLNLTDAELREKIYKLSAERPILGERLNKLRNSGGTGTTLFKMIRNNSFEREQLEEELERRKTIKPAEDENITISENSQNN